MEQNVFSCHLLQMEPDLKRLINKLKQRRFFGIHNNNDLLQEVMLRLWMKVPKLYDEKKGELKSYCMTAAYYCLQTIANKESNIYFNYEHYSIEQCFQSYQNDSSIDLGRTLITTYDIDNKKHVMINLYLDDLIKLDDRFGIVKLLYEHDGCRKTVCKIIKRSNVYITKLRTRLMQRNCILHMPDFLLRDFLLSV